MIKNGLQEATDQIYDTITGNVGFSIHHVKFNENDVLESEVNSRKGEIKINHRLYGTFIIKVSELCCMEE